MHIPNSQRFLLLDGVRGVAAFGVMSLHFWFGNSVFGTPLASLVDLFFVLSGFVLMPSLAASEKARFLFFKKRLLRFYSVLIPAFFIFVFFNYVDFEAGKFTLTNYSITQIVGAFFLLQMFYSKCVWVLGVLWSLSAELLVNVIAVIFFPLNQKVLLPIFFGAFIFIVSLSDVIQSGIDWSGFQNFTGIGRAMLGFYFGLWSRKLYNETEDRWIQNPRGTKWLVITMLLGAMWFLIIVSPYFFVLTALSYSFLVVTIARIDERSIPVAVLRVSKYLGRISFQMYIWHPFVFKINVGGFFARNLADVPTVPLHLISGTITVAITILLCEVSIMFFEKPLMKIGKHFL